MGLLGGSVGLFGGFVGMPGGLLVGGIDVFTGPPGDRSEVLVGRVNMDEVVVGRTLPLGVAVSGGLTGRSSISAI